MYLVDRRNKKIIKHMENTTLADRKDKEQETESEEQLSRHRQKDKSI